jgi:hypothetical protein
MKEYIFARAAQCYTSTCLNEMVFREFDMYKYNSVDEDSSFVDRETKSYGWLSLQGSLDYMHVHTMQGHDGGILSL